MPYTKISSKWIKDLNVRPDTIKLRGKHRQNTLWHKSQQRLQSISRNNRNKNKWDLLKLKSFSTAKETISQTKRLPTDWQKIFVNDVTDKGLVSKIYKQLMTLNSIKTKNSLKKWAEDWNRHFSKEDIQMAKRWVERCSRMALKHV